jgi:hypothetical protein
MTFTAYKKNKDIRSIRQGDPDFMIDDGMIRYPRAMLHITPECPQSIQQSIMIAIDKGWLKTAAYVYGKELTMDALR